MVRTWIVFGLWRWRQAASWLGALMMACAAAPAESAGDALGDALARDAELTLHFRSYYLQRERSSGPESLAWAGGGWLAYRSGWLGDTLRLGLTGYTSQKLLGPEDKDGTALLLPGQRPYSVLGESFIRLKHEAHELTGGRFLVNSFEINPQDTRMTPRTFEGVALQGVLAGGSYFLAGFDRMKARNADEFVQVARVAGAPVGVEEPLWQFGLRLKPDERLALGLSAYHLSDLLTSAYADARWDVLRDPEQGLRLHAQYFHQRSHGENLLLDGEPFQTWNAGLKVEWLAEPFSLAGVVVQNGRGAAYRTPFGSWIGYTSRIITNFNRAGEHALGVDATLDFSRLGVPGLALITSATKGRNAFAVESGEALPRNREYDLTLDYRFNRADWPSWVRPLCLRARVARLEQAYASQTQVTSEYHVILNYELVFD